MNSAKEILHDYSNIEFVPMGLWKERTALSFAGKGASNSRLNNNGGYTVQVDSIDNVCSSEKVTYIKMDIEGAEFAALEGAQHVITRDRPRLAICIYHKPEDLYEIPLLIKRMVPEYKLYMRHHSFSSPETVIYATI